VWPKKESLQKLLTWGLTAKSWLADANKDNNSRSIALKGCQNFQWFLTNLEILVLISGFFFLFSEFSLIWKSYFSFCWYITLIQASLTTIPLYYAYLYLFIFILQWLSGKKLWIYFRHKWRRVENLFLVGTWEFCFNLKREANDSLVIALNHTSLKKFSCLEMILVSYFRRKFKQAMLYDPKILFSSISIV
jgi:hypothetical protein